jgi:HD-like signal output (HDOD) protein
VKVLDFGIAKLLKTKTEVKPVGHHTRLGALIGTPAYMSPEQCLGEATLDHRSDIYSLGVVTYLMLTGRLPFLEESLGRLIMAHVNDTPAAPSTLSPSISPDMSAVVMKALEKKPEDRYPTMRDFRRALDEVAGIERTPIPVVTHAPPSGAVKTPPSVLVGAGASLGRARGPEPSPRAVVASAPAGVSQKPTTPGPIPVGSTMAIGAAASQAAKDEALYMRLLGLVRDRLFAGKMELPQLSTPTVNCIESLRNPEHAFGKLAGILSQDGPLVSRVMKFANSALFQSRAPATSLEQAIGRIGRHGLQSVLVEFGARPHYDGKENKFKELFRGPWTHALATAMIAERLMNTFGQPDLAAPVYMAGLLHDIGKPIVGEFLLAAERQTTGMRGRKWMTDEVWLRTIQATFRPVSVEVAKSWHMPVNSLLAIERAGAYQKDSGRSGGSVLRFANSLAAREGYYLRRSDLEGLDADLVAGRAHLHVDEKTEAKVLNGLKNAVTLSAGIRGG